MYKYAFRGFGIRILPCYMDGLTLDIQQRRPHEGALARHQYGYSRDGSKVLSGLKAVKRIAFVAEDMVRRFVLNEGNQEDARLDEEFDNRRWSEGVPVCSFKVLDSLKQHIGQPGGRVGIKSFEQFFRHCAAWKFECEGRLRWVSGWALGWVVLTVVGSIIRTLRIHIRRRGRTMICRRFRGTSTLRRSGL